MDVPLWKWWPSLILPLFFSTEPLAKADMMGFWFRGFIIRNTQCHVVSEVKSNKNWREMKPCFSRLLTIYTSISHAPLSVSPSIISRGNRLISKLLTSKWQVVSIETTNAYLLLLVLICEINQVAWSCGKNDQFWNGESYHFYYCSWNNKAQLTI